MSLSALSALGKRTAGNLEYGEAYDDPTRESVQRYLQSAGGDYNLAAKAAWNERERKRKINNMGGGQSLLSAENQSRFGGSDAQMLQVATKLKNLAASKGKTSGAYDDRQYRPTDPRMTTQGRAEYGRMAQAALAQHTRQTQQAQAQADGDRQRLAERQRMATEGDAWLADQQQKSQALLALGTRNARAY